MNYSNLTQTSPKIEHPDGLECMLKPHQLTAIAAMAELENKGSVTYVAENNQYLIQTNSCLLSDKIGAGKTFTILGLILYQPTPPNHGQYIDGTKGFAIKIDLAEYYNINLIIVPHNLINQWVSFIQKSSLSFLKYNTENDLTELEQKPLADIIKNKSVIILNINRYASFKSHFTQNIWARVIIDEVDTIRMPASFKEDGLFNWGITSTPDFKRQSNFIKRNYLPMCDYLSHLTVKNADDYVDQSMVVPVARTFIINTKLQKSILAFKDLIPKEAMELINAGNIDRAMSLMSCNVDTEENIAQLLTKSVQTELTILKADRVFIKSTTVDGTVRLERLQKNKEKIIACKTKINSIKDRLKSINDENCLICMESFTCPTVLNCCKVVVCLNCLFQCLKATNNCPHCRNPIKTTDDYHVINNVKNVPTNVKNNEDYFNTMDKVEAFHRILCRIHQKTKTPSILVFSDYSETFNKLTAAIDSVGLVNARIDGTPVRINKIIHQFNEKSIHVLLLNSTHYGSGLNLQAANYVILFHRMNAATETQVIGRANRYGRNRLLKIIYLVNETEDNCTTTNDSLTLNTVEDLSKMIK